MIERSIKIDLNAQGFGSLEVSTYRGIVNFTVRAHEESRTDVMAWDMPGHDAAKSFLLEALRLVELAEVEEAETDEP